MVVTNVCDLTDGFLWFVCGLYVGILMSPPIEHVSHLACDQRTPKDSKGLPGNIVVPIMHWYLYPNKPLSNRPRISGHVTKCSDKEIETFIFLYTCL